MRPLDRVGSIKLKLGIVIVAAVVASVVVVQFGARTGWPMLPVTAAAVLGSLAIVQVLAHGMTAPLRQMAQAATRLADGRDHRPVTASSRDEVGELARAFNSMAAQVAETDRLRRDLVANASHELRTPVAALRAVLENLVDGVGRADEATLAGLLAQVDRLQTLLDQLLDLSRLEAGVTALDRRPIDLRGPVDHAVATVTAARDGAPIEVDVGDASLWADVDGARVEQVLVNLLTNARRHAPHGTTVEVTGRRRGSHVELAVTDAGSGVAAELRETVFERFHRVEPDRATDTGGAGLGLAISREIVGRHGGQLTIDPDHHPGCRVVLTLPTATQEPVRAR